MTPCQAIKKKCLECSGGNVKEVKTCLIKDCPLFSLRLGNNPKRQGIGDNPTLPRKKTNSSWEISPKNGILEGL